MMITTWRILWMASGVPSGSRFPEAVPTWCRDAGSFVEPSGGAVSVAGCAR